jgi:hypothetical protein
MSLPKGRINGKAAMALGRCRKEKCPAGLTHRAHLILTMPYETKRRADLQPSALGIFSPNKGLVYVSSLTRK